MPARLWVIFAVAVVVAGCSGGGSQTGDAGLRGITTSRKDAKARELVRRIAGE